MRARAAAGTARPSRRAPRRARASRRSSSRTPGSTPALCAGQLLGHAQPDALEVLGARQRDLARELERGRVAAVAADHVRAAAAPRRSRRGSAGRPDRARRRTRSSRSASTLRRSASARRSRTAPPAGGSSRRCRCRSPTARGRRRRRRRCRRRSRPGTRRAVPRVEHRPERRVLVRGAHRELVLVGLAEQRRARLGQLLHDGRRVRRAVALEDPRARLARHALGAEQVLDRHRHAAERSARRTSRRPAAPSATHVNAFSSSAAARSR